jgi:hypothetical protein
LWPDFRGLHLLEGIAEYQKRERRYGGLNGDSHAHSSGEIRTSMADLAVELRSNGTNSENDSDSENTDSGNREKLHHSKLHASKVTRKH